MKFSTKMQTGISDSRPSRWEPPINLATMLVCIAMGALGNPAVAQPARDMAQPPAETDSKTQSADKEAGLRIRANLLGDMGGLRSELGKHGMTLGLTEASCWHRSTFDPCAGIRLTHAPALRTVASVAIAWI